jgi:hypothetical protein
MVRASSEATKATYVGEGRRPAQRGRPLDAGDDLLAAGVTSFVAGGARFCSVQQKLAAVAPKL